MQCDHDFLLEIVEPFQNAALDGAGWEAALRGLAGATGSRSGELIGLGSETGLTFHLFTDVDPLFLENFVAMGGDDPRCNPRVKAGAAAPPLQTLVEADYLTPEEYAANPQLTDFARRWDLAFSCLTTLVREEDQLIGLAVIRSKREGHITAAQRALFTAVAPHVRAAVRTQLALESNGAAVLRGTLEALSLAAFVCDRHGTVKAMTAAAEALVGSGRGLRLKSGRLVATTADDSRTLADAIDAAAVLHTRPHQVALRTLILRAPNAGPLALDVIALPSRHYELTFAPRVLVVARGPAADVGRRRAAIVQAAYSLTAAEADVALRLADGETAEAIAAARRVAVGTIRAQIKSVLAKVGVKRQIELVSRLGRIR